MYYNFPFLTGSKKMKETGSKMGTKSSNRARKMQKKGVWVRKMRRVPRAPTRARVAHAPQAKKICLALCQTRSADLRGKFHTLIR